MPGRWSVANFAFGCVIAWHPSGFTGRRKPDPKKNFPPHSSAEPLFMGVCGLSREKNQWSEKFFSFHASDFCELLHQIEGTTPETQTENRNRNTQMKIKPTESNLAAATEILSYLRGDSETIARRVDPVVALNPAGMLLFYNAACGSDDSETVLIDRLESDSMGDGWDAPEVTPLNVIEWLSEFAL